MTFAIPLAAAAALVVGLLAAAPAQAEPPATIVSFDVPLRDARGLAAVSARRPFTMVGFHWRGSGGVHFRTRLNVGRLDRLAPAAPEAEDLPDAGSAEPAGGGTGTSATRGG